MNFIRTSDNYYPVFMWQILQMFPNLTLDDLMTVSYHDGINGGEYLPVYPTDVPADDAGGTWVEHTPVYNSEERRWQATWMFKQHDAATIKEELESAKSAKKAQLSQKRYEVETSGITVNGFTIKTDRESQAQITCAVFAIERGYLTKIDWKGENGWIEMDTRVIASLPPLVSNHVQLCFQTEKQISDMIDGASNMMELNSIDIEIGWPTGIYSLNE